MTRDQPPLIAFLGNSHTHTRTRTHTRTHAHTHTHTHTHTRTQSLQMAMFLYSVCHVVLIVIDSMETSDVIFRFLGTVEQMKSVYDRGAMDMPNEIR